MKQITIYGLLSKIYNNNTDMPKKIKYEDRIYEWKEYNVGYQKKKKVEWQKEWGYVAEIDRTYYYLKHCYKKLNDIVEVIEEDNPKTLKFGDEVILTRTNCDDIQGFIISAKGIEPKEDKDIPLIPDDELCNLKNNVGLLPGVANEIDFNFIVLKDKINELVKEINEIKKGDEIND